MFKIATLLWLPATTKRVSNILSRSVLGAAVVCVFLAGCGSSVESGSGGASSGDGNRTPGVAGSSSIKAKTISVGGFHACAVLEAGDVKCWGDNALGQLGNGSDSSISGPVAVSGLNEPTRTVAAGRYHTCAALESGAVKCWGGNESGEAGSSKSQRCSGGLDESNGDCRLEPVIVEGLTGSVEKLSAGWYHTCALLQSGAIACWGDNGSGALGDGSKTPSPRAVTVKGLSGKAVDVSAGDSFTCALLDSGSVQCWGDNEYGKLSADPETAASESTAPITVSGLGETAGQVTTATGHGCALLTSGAVQCWGENVSGELGDGTSDDSATPVAVSGLNGSAKAVGAGGSHSCALLEDGSVQCWGTNRDGDLGSSQVSTGDGANSATPVSVEGLGGKATAIAVGTTSTCALLEDSSVRCWGDNFDGQLGSTSVGKSSTPLEVK